MPGIDKHTNENYTQGITCETALEEYGLRDEVMKEGHRNSSGSMAAAGALLVNSFCVAVSS